ncbi:hypothetical protein DPMN_119531 [Dreissena polymorpha]|uniref:Uncharacterized protein n=1 Tax=Dreissena polymorpha TaxID=45954 RepID=A0A9D4GM56_DREPO|nr:hypothetical protein DPMN_119531 [Dreissena polymorpha]
MDLESTGLSLGDAKEIYFKDVAAMIVIEDKIILADRKSSTIVVYKDDFEVASEMHFASKQVGFFWGITDMSVLKDAVFGVLVPGFLRKSECWFYELQSDDTVKYLRTIALNKRCYGICFQRDFLFATFSPAYGSPGYVRMLDLQGKSLKKFMHDKNKKQLFSNRISKIYVDSKFRIFVCDDKKRELLILKKDEFDDSISYVTSHKYSVLTIAIKRDGTSFLSTDSDDGVVLLHQNGKWIFNNFLSAAKLSGKPSAVAYTENGETSKLIVVIKSKYWFRSHTKLVCYYLCQTKDTEARILMED